MRKLYVLAVIVMLSGCAAVQSWIPSFWDANQSARITDVQLSVDRLNCAADQLSQVSRIRDDLRWFELYSVSKGKVQQDVLKVIAPMQETVEDMYKRNTEGRGSAVYCELKKRIMQQQAARAAAAVQGRW
jgi:hypothetical protein